MSRQLDVLFINPGAQEKLYQDLAGDLIAIEPPAWCGMLAAYCRNLDYGVEILDAEALHLSPNAAAEEVVARKPRLAVMVVYGHQPSASTQSMTAAGETLRAVRQLNPEIPTLIVGGHVSALPERTLREEAVDFVCEGEGPLSIRALLEAYRGDANPDPSKIPGIWYRDGEEFRFTGRAENLEDLDAAFPRAAWDLLPMDRYRAHNWHCFDHIEERMPYASFYTSLGCPYRCSFCCINAPFGRSGIRYHSPDQIIGQIDHLVEHYGIRNIKIVDEMFVLNPKQTEAICDRIIERGHDLNIWAYARIDTVREGLLPKLKQAGFNWLALGIESGSKHVRDGARKKFGQEDIVSTVREIQNAEIRVIGNYIFGLPDDDENSMQETLDLAIDLNCEFANFYAAMAYPGSPLYQNALQRGWALPATWDGYSQHAYESLPLPTEKVSAATVLRFRDNAFHQYFENPRYLDMVKSKFGPKTLTHVQSMSQKRLKRKHV